MIDKQVNRLVLLVLELNKKIIYNLTGDKMAQKDYYIVKKKVDKIINRNQTNFLDPLLLKKVISKLKGYDYQIYYPYKESEKVILYTDELPNIKLLEIITYDKLSHREIMGSLFGMNLDSETFGDIIIENGHYYIMIIDSLYNLITNDLKMIGNHSIKLKEVPLQTIENYRHKYEKIEMIVSSLRIDTIVSKIAGTSRDSVKKLFKEGLIVLNYEKVNKTNHLLREGDTFSIRKYGKYKYMGIIKNTKKGGYIIGLDKYIDE